MPYAKHEDEINWRQNNRDYHQTPDKRKKQKIRRINKRKKALENLPDKYEYDNSNNKKSQMRYTWIKKGLKACDFERTWDRYIHTENCDICNISLKKVRKNMDHNHTTGYMRFIVCHRCNGFLRYTDKYHNNVINQLNDNHFVS